MTACLNLRQKSTAKLMLAEHFPLRTLAAVSPGYAMEKQPPMAAASKSSQDPPTLGSAILMPV